MLTILQLSDIHFAHSEGATYDLDREIQDGLRRFLPGLRDQVGANIDLVVVSGDIAFSGVADQYERAKGFLRDIRSKLGDATIPVRVIPGNHDVHRKTARTAEQRVWRSTPRQASMKDHERLAALVGLLEDKTSGPGLLEPLKAYNEFASNYQCEIDRDNPHWEHRFSLGDGWTLRLRGLTSVLISDEHDDDDDNRLMLGSMQLSSLDPEPGEVVLTMCHHPYCWLLDGAELRPKFQNRCHMLITGHVHKHDFTEDPQHVHLRTGALQPPRSEELESRFNVITLKIAEGKAGGSELELTLLPLVWDADSDTFMIDEDNCKACCVAVEEPTEAAAAAEPDPAELVAISRLTEKLGSLPLSDRLHSARHVGVAAAQVQSLPAAERVGAIVEHASVTAQLEALWDCVDLRAGNQGEPNPFLEASP